jgi:hypothetical protein
MPDMSALASMMGGKLKEVMMMMIWCCW